MGRLVNNKYIMCICPHCNLINRSIDENCIACGTILHKDNETGAEEYFFLGEKLFYEGKLDEAISNWEKGLNLEPDYTSIYYNLGFAYKKAGEWEKAYKYFMRYLEEPEPGKEETVRNIVERLSPYGKNEEEKVPDVKGSWWNFFKK